MFGDLEQFGGGSDQGGEGMSEAAREAFREQQRAASQQLKALQKGEQKKKKKEDKLAKIITELLQKKSRRSDLAMAAAEVLALNVPPAFVLSAILLGDQESQKELSMTIVEDDKGLATENQPDLSDLIALSGNDLSYMMTDDEVQTANLHSELVPWSQMMYIQAKNDPIRMLQNGKVEEEGQQTFPSGEDRVQPVIIELMMLTQRYFLEDRGLLLPADNLRTLSEIIMRKIFEKIQANVDRLQALREAEFLGDAPTQE